MRGQSADQGLDFEIGGRCPEKHDLRRLRSPEAAPQGQVPGLAGLYPQHTDPRLQRVEVMWSDQSRYCVLSLTSNSDGRNK